MERFEIRIEQPNGWWTVLSVSVIPADDAGWMQNEIVAALMAGHDPYKLLVWFPEWLGDRGADAEVEVRADMASFGRKLDRRTQSVGYTILVRPGR